MDTVIRLLVDIVLGWNLVSGGGLIEGTDNPRALGYLLEDQCVDVSAWEVTYDEDGHWVWKYYRHRTGQLQFDYIDTVDSLYWIYCWSYEDYDDWYHRSIQGSN